MTEQLIRRDDLESVLLGAAALYNRDLNREAVNELVDIQESDDLPLSSICELAEDCLRIPRRYIELYINTRDFINNITPV